MSDKVSSYETEYHSSIGSREAFGRSSQRGSVGTASSGRTLRIVSEVGASSVAGISPAMGAEAASSILESREREKKDMQELNDRLGAYIDKVRFLEAQNRKLVEDLEAVRGKWGKDTAGIKAQYVIELSEARKLIDDTSKGKGAAEVTLARLMADMDDVRNAFDVAVALRASDRDKLDSYTAQLSDSTTEIEQLKRRLSLLQGEYGRYEKENHKFESDLAEAKDSLDKETTGRIDFQNQAQTLLEEIEFQRRVHEQEVRELEALMSKDSPQTTKDYFKNELALAISDIRVEYDNISTQNKGDMESWYKLKVQEVSNASQRDSVSANFQRDESKRVRDQLENARAKLNELEDKNAMLEKQLQELTYQLSDDQRQYEAALNDRDIQIRRMREEVTSLMMELQALMETKQSLDAEIAIYRRMLEGEESRAGLKTMVEDVVKAHTIEKKSDVVIDSPKTVRGEVSQKTSFQRSAKGNVTIADVQPEGKFIVLENTNRSKDENMEEWKLKRKVDGKKEYVFVFPKGYILKAGKSVKIWAKNAGGTLTPPDNLIFEDSNTWGVGKSVGTSLYNKDGEERATHVQKTVETKS